MPDVTEIAKDVYRISTFLPDINMQINQFIVDDDEPLLWHTGLKEHFSGIRQSAAEVIDPSKIRWIGFSHFEADECGALNEWLQTAPSAQTVCSIVGASVNLNDYAIRTPRGITSNEIINTGKYRFRFYPTPHLPHGWDAGMLFEETNQTLFCSDLFHQNGDRESLISSREELVERTRNVLKELQNTPLAHYMPFTSNTEQLLFKLADLKPATLAVMHGSSLAGDGRRALQDLAVEMQEVYDRHERRQQNIINEP